MQPLKTIFIGAVAGLLGTCLAVLVYLVCADQAVPSPSDIRLAFLLPLSAPLPPIALGAFIAVLSNLLIRAVGRPLGSGVSLLLALFAGGAIGRMHSAGSPHISPVLAVASGAIAWFAVAFSAQLLHWRFSSKALSARPS